MTRVSLTLAILLSVAGSAAAQNAGFRWPGAARAAVALTYDDGADGHLDVVAPDLDAVGLHGTFYVSGRSGSLDKRMDEWRDVARRGHEIGSHSLFHPCVRVRSSGEVYDWLRPEYALEKYTVRQMVEELRISNVLFRAVDGRPARSYAYPCSDEVTCCGESYVDGLRPLFPAARAGGGEIVENLRTLDLHRVPCRSYADRGGRKATGAEMIATVEEAARAGGMAVLCFHGVGGGHSINLARDVHQELLDHLDRNRDRFWTDTFLNVMTHVIAERKRLGWDAGR